MVLAKIYQLFESSVMNRELLLRVRASEGQYRISVMSRDTFGELLLQLAKKLSMSIKDVMVSREDGKLITISEGTKLGDIPYFVDGAILKVNSRNPKKQVVHSGIKASDIESNNNASKCNHPPGGKCLNCMSNDKKPPLPKGAENTEDTKYCKHGPGGKCMHCTPADSKDKTATAQMMCQHGPNAKCIHCLDKQFIGDAAHISFDNWLADKKLKCKGVHPQDVKCNNCLPPSQVRYQIDRTCKKHEPYPKAMCNKCMPPNVLTKRQEFRHVDYVQFMNTGQIQNFVSYWLPRSHEQQRVGFLYGYYAEDSNYKGGIRVIVQALYEPKQKGTYSDFQILEQGDSPILNSVITGLTLERVGWIFTDSNHDVVMSAQHVKMAAKLQEQFKVPHQSGYDISNFISVILRPDEKNPNDIKPEVYMISDQGQALEKANLFIESGTRRKMEVKVNKESNDAYPSFICQGKTVTEFEPEFLLVKIAHGTAKNNKFSIIKKAEFPPLIRDKPSKKDMKEYMKRNKNIKQSHVKYGDFNFLLYLAQQIDPATAHSISECVANEEQVQGFIDDLIENKADL